MSDQTNPIDSQEWRPVIGISLGDFNGIGVEVILKTLGNPHVLKICTPVIYGSIKIISKYRKLLKLKEWYIHQINSIDQVALKKPNLISVAQSLKFEVQPGKVAPDAGQFAIESLVAATEDLKKGALDAIVTAPISKANVQSEGFPYPGHTEFFTSTFEVADSLMLMVCDDLRIGVVTGHVPLSEVSSLLTRERLTSKTNILLKSLQDDFGISKPKIAILGFNPHAGEEGLLGDEENQIIRPVILDMKKKGALIYGPFPADSFFGTGDFKKFDAILAIYHDQGLIPFKTMAFERGVNFTAGLPIVRTSPDHGTAFAIAGKDLADDSSFREALFLAHDIAKHRRETKLLLESKLESIQPIE